MRTPFDDVAVAREALAAAMMDTTTAAQLTGGRRVGTNAMFRRVTTDTRELRTGDLFVAIAGERFDGHDFVAAALAGGASAAMVDAAHAKSLAGNLVAVADTARGARHARRGAGGGGSRCRSSSSPAATARPR